MDATPKQGLDLSQGNYFAEDQYTLTNLQQGVVTDRSGTRLCLLNADFLIGLSQALQDGCGPNAAAVLRRAGHAWGRKLAARLQVELPTFYKQDPYIFQPILLRRFVAEALSALGWGKLKLNFEHQSQGIVEAVIAYPVYGNLRKTPSPTLPGGASKPTMRGGFKEPQETLTAGILGGIFSQLTSEDLDCQQTDCVGCGAAESRFIIAAADRLTEVPQWLRLGNSHQEILRRLQSSSQPE